MLPADWAAVLHNDLLVNKTVVRRFTPMGVGAANCFSLNDLDSDEPSRSLWPFTVKNIHIYKIK